MKDPEDDRTPSVACLPGEIPAEKRERHFKLARELFGSRAVESRQLPDGYAFRFEDDACEAIAAFVANERKCCPFLIFELTVSADSGPVWLRITGPPGTLDVLRAELEGVR